MPPEKVHPACPPRLVSCRSAHNFGDFVRKKQKEFFFLAKRIRNVVENKEAGPEHSVSRLECY